MADHKKENADYLDTRWDPYIAPSRPKPGESHHDQPLAPEGANKIGGARERFRNRKINAKGGNTTEGYAMAKGYTKLKSLKVLNQVATEPDRRWPGNAVPRSQNEKRFKAKLERQYEEDLHHKDGDIHRLTPNSFADVETDQRKQAHNPNFEYFPAKHHQGHDHRLGFMPFAITWYDERHDYWKGTWQDPNKKG